MTPAFALGAKFIIHTVGPKWNGGESGELLALADCYRNVLEKAKELGCESIAFPLISSGVFQFPKEEALKIALQTIGDFLLANEMNVSLVVYDRKSFEVSEDLSGDIQSFIDDNYVQDKIDSVEGRVWRYADEEYVERRQSSSCKKDYVAVCENACFAKDAGSLEDMLAHAGETFCNKLFSLIREKNQDDVEIYKRANLDRKHFSKIRSNVNYKPTKKTALALAIALQLDLDETKDLLARAELALSPSNKGDLIVVYFINHKKYDIWEINSVLFKFGQPTLGV